jgi:hypothetical protein
MTRPITANDIQGTYTIEFGKEYKALDYAKYLADSNGDLNVDINEATTFVLNGDGYATSVIKTNVKSEIDHTKTAIQDKTKEIEALKIDIKKDGIKLYQKQQILKTIPA